MLSLFLSFILIFGNAVSTCQDQTASTVPTWGQCIANQFER